MDLFVALLKVLVFLLLLFLHCSAHLLANLPSLHRPLAASVTKASPRNRRSAADKQEVSRYGSGIVVFFYICSYGKGVDM